MQSVILLHMENMITIKKKEKRERDNQWKRQKTVPGISIRWQTAAIRRTQ